MKWIEGHIRTTGEGTEPLLGLLMVMGIRHTQVQDAAEMRRHFAATPGQWDYIDEGIDQAEEGAEIVFYAEGGEAIAAVAANLQTLSARIPEIDWGPLTLTHTVVDDADWLHEWKKTYKPFTIGRVVVRPYWEAYEAKPGQTVFTIDPGAVFGTGLHATTHMCVLALQEWAKLTGAAVLDVGCGSGILSVIALLLGAETAYALDIDPAAETAARANAGLNKIAPERYTARTADIFAVDLGKRFDLILANIVADAIIPLAARVSGLLNPDGRFISGGIITERLPEVRAAFEAQGLSIISEQEMDGWHCLAAEVCDA